MGMVPVSRNSRVAWKARAIVVAGNGWTRVRAFRNTQFIVMSGSTTRPAIASMDREVASRLACRAGTPTGAMRSNCRRMAGGEW